MQADDLKYNNLQKLLAPLAKKGKTESITFLNWFLENIYRLDSVSADDCICDKTNDKGIDAIYVDTNNEEIHFFQGKLRQKENGTIGDVDPKNLVASVGQFDSAAKIDAILQGNAAQELKNILIRLEVKDLISKGYRPIAILVSNELNDADSSAYAAQTQNLRIFDRAAIAADYIDAEQGVGVTGSFTFDLSYVDPLVMTTGGAAVFVFPARALELVALGGIADTSLFTKNVRFDLGNTSVNKSIRASISSKPDHKNFPLFHNGIIILCHKAELSSKKLTIDNYSVVNGAQSLTTFFKSKSKLTDDLRVLVRVIALQDDALARKITEFSNNQNAIKPRDLRSNHTLMTRLQSEMDNTSKEYFFEIKRGEIPPKDRKVISNEDAGRALLAIDIGESWSCHQIYRIFDEKYAEIFGRQEVNATRIIHSKKLIDTIEANIDSIALKSLAHYALTKYFLASALSRILRHNKESVGIMRDPSSLPSDRADQFYKKCGAIVANLIIDLNYEVGEKGPSFDYKADLKSPKQTEELISALIRSYEKDVARGKAESFDGWSGSKAVN